MEKTFDPASYETKWQESWRDRRLFVCPVPDPADRASYSIMIPPPNVTGRLHMGHALQSSLQDVLVRWQRMKGKNALWLPGTDHAGIATQLMVERALEKEGQTRIGVGREEFERRLWEWKEQYQSNIRRQLQRLGSSCDFSRERFTLDEGLSEAVRIAFVRLHREGLIHRSEYMVNWSPSLGTAISDLEVETRTVQGKLYHFSYPLEDGSGSVVVATTRPETMLGDTAVAVHPDDDRYRALIGRSCVLPLIGRLLPIVADRFVDPEFGTGAVKITPFHDPNDFELARRHGLDGVRVIGFDGRMTEEAGEFVGLDRFDARARVVDRLADLGRLVKVVDHELSLGHSQRSGEPVEPMVSMQWFCDVSGMAGKALEAVRDGELALVPATWEKTWEHWLTNIRPWCISRQLWWGHRIPAWYSQQGECFVASSYEEACELAGTSALQQDPDVLDTWFSSALWPMSTLGWPCEEAADYKVFYPTDTLVTGFDILFFWVARMVMFGLHFTEQVPFHAVHLTGLVRDARGDKMSKTKGNVLDPLDLIEEYGADAVRFTLCALDSPGRDIPLNPDVMGGYRAFGNKIWNAVRFALSRVGDTKVPEDLEWDQLRAPERWILSRLSRTAREVDIKFESFRFDEACQRLYQFFWRDLCDWYLELAKPALEEGSRPFVAETLLFVVDASLRLLQPVMPHLTEELWQRLPRSAGPETSIAFAPFPRSQERHEDGEVEAGMVRFQALVSYLRAFRKQRGLLAADGLAVALEGGEGLAFVSAHADLIRQLVVVDSLTVGRAGSDAIRDRVEGIDIALELRLSAASAEQEEVRARRELEKVEAELAAVVSRLANESFLGKAPAAVVEGAQKRLAELTERRNRLAGGIPS